MEPRLRYCRRNTEIRIRSWIPVFHPAIQIRATDLGERGVEPPENFADPVRDLSIDTLNAQDDRELQL